MSNAQRTALQQFDLRRVRHRKDVRSRLADLFGSDLVSDRKHKLQVFQSSRARNDSAECFRDSVLQCTHGNIDDRLACKPLPWELHRYAAIPVMPRAGVVELRQVWRAIKVEISGSLCDPQKWGNGGIRIFPVDGKSSLARILPGHGRGRFQ